MANYHMLDGLQQAVIADEQKKQANKKKAYKFDKLALLFGEVYEVNGIKILQPTIGDILRVGEENFYQALSPFLCNSTSIRVMLWDAGVDWCTIKDIEVFDILNNIQKQNDEILIKLTGNKNTKRKESLKTIFKDIDITDFNLYSEKETEDSEEKLCLYSEQYGIKLYEDDYMEIAEYIREMMNVHPKVEKAKGKYTKKSMIDEDRMNALQKDNKNTSTLLPLVSGCINHPGFKYKLQELREVGIYQFMDAVQRLQLYEQTCALSHGRYAGFCDLSNIPDDNFNIFRNIS